MDELDIERFARRQWTGETDPAAERIDHRLRPGGDCVIDSPVGEVGAVKSLRPERRIGGVRRRPPARSPGWFPRLPATGCAGAYRLPSPPRSARRTGPRSAGWAVWDRRPAPRAPPAACHLRWRSAGRRSAPGRPPVPPAHGRAAGESRRSSGGGRGSARASPIRGPPAILGTASARAGNRARPGPTGRACKGPGRSRPASRPRSGKASWRNRCRLSLGIL